MTWASRDFQPFEIDLVSDNASRPSQAMREFMVAADVGDEERGEDPTVRELEEMAAELMGKPAAAFMPSGTMCNVVAFDVWCEHGDGLLLHEDTHPVYSKYAGPHIHHRLELHTLPGERGVLSPAAIEAKIAAVVGAGGRPRLLSLENTHNRTGGSVWSLEAIAAASEVARTHDLRVHVDGARMLNAVVSSGVSAADYCAPVDSAWIDLSKALGCPMGAVMAGSEEFVTRVRQAKYLFGGITHKAGMMAAAGIYALRHHVRRLTDDHARALELAEGLAVLDGVELAQERVETNIVYFDVAPAGLDAALVLDEIARAGVRMKQISETTIRAVTHLDIARADTDRAVSAVESALERLSAGQ